MAGPLQLRAGWENEHLATYLLSRISFVARPITVADDVGTDLYCTLFMVDARNRAQPRNSLAVQIKSNRRAVDVTDKIQHLLYHLELPLYLGVLTRASNTLALYSGRYLPNLLSLKGDPRHPTNGNRKLKLKPVQRVDRSYYNTRVKCYELLCPLVTTLDVADDAAARARAVQALHQDAVLFLRAIASKLNHEYIFDTPSGELEIVAGQTSAKHYQANYFKRLAEAFENLLWEEKARSRPAAEIDRDIETFKAVYDVMRKRMDVPPYVTQVAGKLQSGNRALRRA